MSDASVARVWPIGREYCIALFCYWALYIEETISIAVFDSVFVTDFASEDAKPR